MSVLKKYTLESTSTKKKTTAVDSLSILILGSTMTVGG